MKGKTMIPRPFQNRLVGRAKTALQLKGNTLAVAPTGAGKTCMMGFLGHELREAGHGRHLFLQHRQELVTQNLGKYRLINPKARVSLYTAEAKSMRGDAVFAMAQTLTRNLGDISEFDVLFLDEAHHAAAPTWRKIVDAVLAKNPNCLVAGFTATPERGDKKSLRTVFDNVCDQISLRELVQLGFLVPPKAFVLDVGGTQERLRQLSPGSDWAEQSEVESILNTVAINEEVVRHWREMAGNRCTVVFASTVHHAMDVANAFRVSGVSSECVHGGLADSQRQAILRRFARGEIQVLTNCMVLTEGFDHPPTSCVILLRRCSEKGALIQMAGRGLRTVNPEEHPGLVKKDCIILDFGTSLLTHGDLNMEAMLKEKEEREPDEAITKICPEESSETYRVPDSQGRKGCGAELPANVKTCPLCGFQFERKDARDDVTITQVELTEMEILDASPFRYVDLFGSGRAMIAKGFDAWAGIFSPDGDTWHALGKTKAERRLHRIASSERIQAMAAADDFLRMHETDGAAKKTKRWLDEPATIKQVEMLARFGYTIEQDLLGASNFTKYSAACHFEFQVQRALIEQALGVAA
ncbi:MAG: type III restriction enzyme res [Desulfovibrionaceae bacterium]|nr:MAG: type III restriction enzyme res [Desulfovibrionaceae bacterium]